MQGPAKHGALIYASDVTSLADFYITFFNMQKVRETPQFVSLMVDDFNVIIHEPPISMPEGERFSATKFFLTVDSLEQAKQQIVAFGGRAYEGEWENPLFKVCNISDPEGNMLQVREFKG